MAEEGGRVVEEAHEEEGPEFETLATLVEAGALQAAEREELAARVARARVIFLTGEDAARVDVLFTALMEEVEHKDGRGPMMLPPPVTAVPAEEQLESMRDSDAYDDRGQVMAVYSLQPENVVEACRFGGGGKRVLAQLDEVCTPYAVRTSRGGGGTRPAPALAELVSRGLSEAGYEGGEGEVLFVYAGGSQELPGRVSMCWVHADREAGERRRVVAFLGAAAAATLAAFVAGVWMGAAGWSGRAVAWAVCGMVVLGSALLLLLGRALLPRPAGGDFGGETDEC